MTDTLSGAMMHRPRRNAPTRRRVLTPVTVIAFFLSLCVWASWVIAGLLSQPDGKPDFLHFHRSPRAVAVIPEPAAVRIPIVAASALRASTGGDASASPISAAALRDTAIVTLVGGDVAGRHALVLFQRLRDVGTRIPHVIALLARGGHGSEACHNATWKKSVGRMSIDCKGSDTIAEEIVSPVFLELFRALGVEVRVIDPVPRTRYTEAIPGRLDSFWGYALSRTAALNFTEFRKVVLIDADTLVLKNLDALVDAPHFSAATTYSCCNHHALPRLSGGLMVFEPSIALGSLFWRLMEAGQPTLHMNGSVDADAGPHTWQLGDTGIALHALTDWHHQDYSGYWPKMADRRHGYVPGLRRLPAYRGLNDSEFARVIRDVRTGEALGEGFLPALHDPARPGGRLGAGIPGLEWHALSLLYGQSIGNVCECSSIDGRDLPDEFITVHIGCLQFGNRPGDYESEAEFLRLAYFHSTSCSRHYYAIWLDALKRTGYDWPGPRWMGPALPGRNETHDALVLAWRSEKK